MWYHDARRRRPLPDRRHLVADRDRLDPDRAAAGRDDRRSPARRRPACPASPPTIVDEQGDDGAARRRRLPRAEAAVAVDAAHVLRRRRPLRRDLLVRASDRASTSPATARRPTRTATSGCSAASTTSSTSPATASRPRRSSRRSCRHPAVAEAAVDRRPRRRQGRGDLRLRDHDRRRRADDDAAQRAARARRDARSARSRGPSLLLFTPDLPKTRSGKIMRRLLKDIAEGRELGDATTLRDPAIVQSIKQSADAQLGRPSGAGTRPYAGARASPAKSGVSSSTGTAAARCGTTSASEQRGAHARRWRRANSRGPARSPVTRHERLRQRERADRTRRAGRSSGTRRGRDRTRRCRPRRAARRAPRRALQRARRVDAARRSPSATSAAARNASSVRYTAKSG